MSNTENVPPVELVRQVDNARLVRGSEGVALYVFFGQHGQWFSMDADEGSSELILQGPESNDFREAHSIQDVIDWLFAARAAVEKEPRLVPRGRPAGPSRQG